nr:uncharacterized protein LOC109155335 [Ipomoea batatas]
MVEVDAADPWFKRHFALLVMSVLIDPMVNGYVNQNYIDHLLDVGNIPNLNWSQMVINALINSKQVWMKSADKLYGGPNLFLMGFINEITSHTRTIATRLLKVARLVENAPIAILEDDRFKKMFESAWQLLGFKAQEDQHLTFSQQEDAFWGNPELLNAIDEIVRVVQKRTYLNDVPSFSLGLTQEEQTQRWDDVSVVARDYNECEQSKKGEENQAREADTTAKLMRSNPTRQCIKSPLEIPPKDQGKRPVVEYSPVRPQQRLSVIDVNAPINATEDAVRKWVLENPHPDPAQELFRFESRVIHWSDMLLLKPNTEIPTIANPLGDEDERYKKFNDSCLVDETFAVETRVQNIQHFLFPIIASGHYYMIHFDPLCDRFDVIDNSSSVPKTEDKYGDVPKKLFLSGLKSSYKANKIQKLKVKRMKMAWRDNRNKIDCGVFLMRHMETFRGQLPELWNSRRRRQRRMGFGSSTPSPPCPLFRDGEGRPAIRAAASSVSGDEQQSSAVATAAGSALAVVSSDLQQRHCGRTPAVELCGAAALEQLING